jgi:hypothetical protein
VRPVAISFSSMSTLCVSALRTSSCGGRLAEREWRRPREGRRIDVLTAINDLRPAGRTGETPVSAGRMLVPPRKEFRIIGEDNRTGVPCPTSGGRQRPSGELTKLRNCGCSERCIHYYFYIPFPYAFRRLGTVRALLRPAHILATRAEPCAPLTTQLTLFDCPYHAPGQIVRLVARLSRSSTRA